MISNLEVEFWKLFPNGDFSAVLSEHSLHLQFPSENKSLIGSDYYYAPKNQLSHFTSLAALNSIVNEGGLRMYNLNNVNDPREFSFVARYSKFNIRNIEDAKNDFYLLSLCDSEYLNSKGNIDQHFNMWRIYGEAGKGVLLEFDFEISDREKWEDFYLSRIHYGDTAAEKLNNFINKMSELSEGNRFQVDLGQTTCFHKSILYQLENEIRLLYDGRKTRAFSSTSYQDGFNPKQNVHIDLSRSHSVNKEVKYLLLPLYRKGVKSGINPCVPLPKITRITLGYNYEGEQFELIGKISKLCSDKLGYKPIIDISPLRKLVFGQ